MIRTNNEVQLVENGEMKGIDEMKKELQVIGQREFEGRQVRIYGSIENPLFIAKDVAEWVENKDVTSMLRNVDDVEKVKKPLYLASADCADTTHGGFSNGTEVWFLTEDGLYETLMQSRKPIAKMFKKKIKEILKDIRTTGGHVSNDDMFVDTYLPFADEATKNLFKVTVQVIRQQNEMIAERDKTIVEKDEKIEKQQPFVDFTKKLLKSKENILVREFAKLMQDENVVDFGQNKMFSWLRGQGYLSKQNEPYQKFVTQGIFQVKKVVKDTAFGVKDFSTTVITPKGQAILWNKLVKVREGKVNT